jgi:hypothetical protein
MLRSESDGRRDAAALTNPFVATYSKVLIAARPSLDFNLYASILCTARIAEKLT